MPLRLRPLLPSDENAFVAGHEAMKADDFEFGLDYVDGMAWSDYVAHIATLPFGGERYGPLVPATFLVAVVDDEIVGRVSIRHTLNPWLERQGGHVGYGVLPAHRRRGYATEMLRQALVIARSHGVDRALVTCDDDNAASARAIERNGGVLENVVTDDEGQALRRYWIA